MMQGTVRKMVANQQLLDLPLSYALPLGDTQIPLNGLIGQTLHLAAQPGITCVGCGARSAKSFNQGYCYRCFTRLAACDLCIMKPETCHWDQGTCREPAWAAQHCQTEHVVYLANTTGLKVGITRASQLPTRWIDQGAVAALPIFRVATRRLSGLIEHLLAQHIADKTQWQSLVKGHVIDVDLVAARDRLRTLCAEPLAAYEAAYPGQIQAVQESLWQGRYPVVAFAPKASSFAPEKAPFSARLTGIKGQYLLFETGVLNVRKYTGFHWTLTV